MKWYLILLSCGLTLSVSAQKPAPSAYEKNLIDDTTRLGKKLADLRQKADSAQLEFIRQHNLLEKATKARDTLHDIDPPAYKVHLDSLNKLISLRRSKTDAAQAKFDGFLVQLDSAAGMYNSSVERLTQARNQRQKAKTHPD